MSVYSVLVDSYFLLQKLDEQGKLGECDEHMMTDGNCEACTVMENLALMIMNFEDGE